ncbi:MAG: hypothetical protein IH977_09770 [Nitrospinae bacterium]|nr:hypothetical protein [Nitrospinota bacterium]
MDSMNISIPDQMKDWVQAQIQAGNFPDAGAYVEELIRRDRLEKESAKNLFRELQKDIAQGVSDIGAGHVQDFDIDRIVQKGRERLASHASSE